MWNPFLAQLVENFVNLTLSPFDSSPWDSKKYLDIKKHIFLDPFGLDTSLWYPFLVRLVEKFVNLTPGPFDSSVWDSKKYLNIKKHNFGTQFDWIRLHGTHLWSNWLKISSIWYLVHSIPLVSIRKNTSTSKNTFLGPNSTGSEALIPSIIPSIWQSDKERPKEINLESKSIDTNSTKHFQKRILLEPIAPIWISRHEPFSCFQSSRVEAPVTSPPPHVLTNIDLVGLTVAFRPQRLKIHNWKIQNQEWNDSIRWPEPTASSPSVPQHVPQCVCVCVCVCVCTRPYNAFNETINKYLEMQ